MPLVEKSFFYMVTVVGAMYLIRPDHLTNDRQPLVHSLITQASKKHEEISKEILCRLSPVHYIDQESTNALPYTNTMASLEEELCQTLSRVLLSSGDEVDGLDEDLMEYISGMLAAKVQEEEDALDVQEVMDEVLVPFLDSVACPEELQTKAQEAVQTLLSKEQEQQSNTQALASSTETRKLAQGVVSMSSGLDKSNNDHEGLDLWGKEGGVAAMHNTLIDAYNTDKENLASARDKRKARKKELEKARKLLSSSNDTDVDQDAGGGLVRMKFTDLSQSGVKDKKKDIQVRNVTVTLDNGTILMDNSELKFAYQRRYGLIGENGVGKSTLLKHIANEDMPDFPSHMRVLHVRQEVPAHLDQDLTVVNAVLNSDVERNHLLQTEKELLAKLEAAGDDDDNGTLSVEERPKKLAASSQSAEGSSIAEMNADLKKLDGVYARLQALGSDSAQSRAAMILSGLQFSPEQQQKPVADLSGGWKMRVALAAALFIQVRRIVNRHSKSVADFHGQSLIFLLFISFCFQARAAHA